MKESDPGIEYMLMPQNLLPHVVRPIQPTRPMNPSLAPKALIGAVLLAAATAELLAHAWETILPRPEIQEASGTQVLIDPTSPDPSNPTVFIGPRAGDGQILYMEPFDATTYQTTPMPGSLGTVYRMGFHQGDASVYAVGTSQLVNTPPFPRKNPSVWTVQKSTFDLGSQNWGTWMNIEKFYLSATEDSTAYGFASDNLGNLYVCGSALLKGYPHWVVRRKLASGGAWTTIADLSARSALTAAYGACFYPGNPSANLPPALFVSGILNGKWTVQRLEQNGSWTVADAPAISGWANSIACDNDGNLFVVGTRSGPVSDYGYGWVIRKSTTGGTAGSWQTVLDVSEGYSSAARHAAVDASGNLWVAGHTGSTMDIQTNRSRWTVVRNGAGQSWLESWHTRQQPFDGVSSNSGARGIATDYSGNVFITGGVTDLTDGFMTWVGPRIVVRRLVP